MSTLDGNFHTRCGFLLVLERGNRYTPWHSTWEGTPKMTTTLRTRILRMAAAGGIIAGAAMLPVYAYASECNNYGGGNCGTESTVVVPTTAGKTAVKHGTSNQGTLPFTGGDVVGLSLVGIGAVAGGTALVRSGRRKSVGA
jgi:hypothetical protein